MKHQEYSKLQQQYQRLPVEERLRRAEFLANYYLGQMTQDCKFIVDATKYWPQFNEMMRQAPAIEAGATTMEQVFNAGR